MIRASTVLNQCSESFQFRIFIPFYFAELELLRLDRRQQPRIRFDEGYSGGTEVAGKVCLFLQRVEPRPETSRWLRFRHAHAFARCFLGQRSDVVAAGCATRGNVAVDARCGEVEGGPVEYDPGYGHQVPKWKMKIIECGILGFCDAIHFVYIEFVRTTCLLLS